MRCESFRERAEWIHESLARARHSILGSAELRPKVSATTWGPQGIPTIPIVVNADFLPRLGDCFGRQRLRA